MAFGIKRSELKSWKNKVNNGEIAFLTHFWLDDRFPNCNTVTKVGCNNLNRLEAWGRRYGLPATYIDKHQRYPHFDLFGDKQIEILYCEQKWEQIKKFKL